MQCLQTFML